MEISRYIMIINEDYLDRISAADADDEALAVIDGDMDTEALILDIRRILAGKRPYSEINPDMLPDEIFPVDNDSIRQVILSFTARFGDKCNLNWLDTSDVTTMKQLFFQSQFEGDISRWDTSNVEDMNQMFKKSIFNGDISKWDVSKVHDFIDMFGHSRFNGDISAWNPVSAKSTGYMFSDSYFNQDISSWRMPDLVFSDFMFRRSEMDRDLSAWDFSRVRAMEYMFLGCPMEKKPQWFPTGYHAKMNYWKE